jgi:hypothetical protein
MIGLRDGERIVSITYVRDGSVYVAVPANKDDMPPVF